MRQSELRLCVREKEREGKWGERGMQSGCVVRDSLTDFTHNTTEGLAKSRLENITQTHRHPTTQKTHTGEDFT